MAQVLSPLIGADVRGLQRGRPRPEGARKLSQTKIHAEFLATSSSSTPLSSVVLKVFGNFRTWSVHTS